MKSDRRGDVCARPGGHRRSRRLAAAVIPFGLILATSVVVFSPSASAQVVQSNIATFYPSDACQGYQVPANINQVDVEVAGGHGAPGSGANSPGGRGGLVNARFEVESGTTLWAVVGDNSGGNAGGGALHHGGAGGTSDKEYALFNEVQYGGGGGGASFLSTDNAHCGTSGSPVNTSDVLIVAGGGGGGGADAGGGSTGGAGGDAGQNGGNSTQDCLLSFLGGGCSGGSNGGFAGTASGPGAGGHGSTPAVDGGPGAGLGAGPSGSGTSWTYVSGGGVDVSSGFGGGGGGGWNGGGQGGNNSVTFGGGGGGANYTSPAASGVSVSVDTTSTPHITIVPVDSRRLLVAKQGSGSGTVTGTSIDCGATCKAFYTTNTVVTLTAAPTAGSRFAGWSGGGCSGTASTCTVTMDVARSVTATFNTIRKLTVTQAGSAPAGSGTVAASPPGFPCGTGCIDFDAGTTVTLTATPDASSVFRGWQSGGQLAFTSCDGQTAPCTFTATDRDLTINANFVQNVLAITKQGGGNGTVSTDVGGISCGDTCTSQSHLYDWGTPVTVTLQPDAGSTGQFLDQADCSATSLTCTLTMNGSPMGGLPFVVSFTKNPENLTVATGGTGIGRVTSTDGRINCNFCTADNAFYDQNSVVTLTAIPTTGTAQQNSTFTGWTGDCTGTSPTCTVTMSQARSVTADFTPVPRYNLLVLPAGNSTGTVTSDIGAINCAPGATCNDNYYQGTTVTLTAAVADPTTSQFTGWGGPCLNAQPAATCSVTVNAATTVIPNFNLLERHLTVTRSGNASGNGKVSAVGAFADSVDFTCPITCAADYDHGNTVFLSETPGAMTTFAGWTGPCTNPQPASTCNVTMDAAKTVNAEFDYQTATLTVSTAGTGTGTVTSTATGVTDGLAINCPAATCSDSFILGSTVVITATPHAADTVFTGWSSGCSNVDANVTGVCNVPLSQSRSITATFTLNQLTVTRAGGGTGTVTSGETTPTINCGATCTHAYPGGTTITLTATPAAGSTFTSWGGACAYRLNQSTCTLTMNGVTNVSATFMTSPRVTVVLSGTGAQFGFVSTSNGSILCGQGSTVCSVALAPGTSITLNSNNPTNQSTSFDGWSGGWCSDTGACTFTPTDAVTVTATYTLHTNTLTVTKSGTGSGTVTSTDTPQTINCGSTCSAAYPILSTVQLSAQPAAFSTFVGWSGACTGTGLCTVSLSAVRTVNAEFEPVPTHTLTIAPTGTGRGTVTSADGFISCPGTCSHAYPSGTSVTLTETPDNSVFNNWGLVACTSTPSPTQCAETVNADTTLAPSFTLNTSAVVVTLNSADTSGASGTVTSTPAGIACPPTCSANFEVGITVALRAVPDANSALANPTYPSPSTPCANDATSQNVYGVCSFAVENRNPGNDLVNVYFVHRPDVVNLHFAGTGAGSVDVNGNTCAADCSVQFTYNPSGFVSLTATAAAGSTFTGWNASFGPFCTASSSSCAIAAQNDISITANFDGVPRTLTVDHGGSPLGDGTVSSLPTDVNCLTGQCQQAFPNGTVVTLTATPNGVTSDFTGWSGACTNTTGTCTVTMTADTQVTANFVLKSRTLTVSKDGFGTGTVTSTTPSGLIACGATCSGSVLNGLSVTLTATPDAGDSFAGWSGACTNTTGDCTVVMSGDMSVTATFEPPLQQLSVSVATGALAGTGTVSSAPAGIDACTTSCSSLFPGDSQVTLTATPDSASSTFFGWSGDCSGSQLTCTVTMNQARSVSARFNLVMEPLHVDLAGTGLGAVQDDQTAISCGTMCDGSYPHGTVVTLTAYAYAGNGSVFGGWSGACTNSTGTCVVTMDQARSVTAIFDPPPMRTLTVNIAGNGADQADVISDPQGVACSGAGGVPCPADFALGTTVTLTENDVPGLVNFTGWTGPCTNQQPATTCTVVVNQAMSVTATFTLVPETLTVNILANNGVAATGSVVSNPPGINCPGTCSADFPINSQVTLTETPDASSLTIASSFAQWEVGCLGTQSTCTVVMAGPATVDAAFNGTTIRHNLTITNTGTGIGSVSSSPVAIHCPSICSFPFNALTPVTLTASPDTTTSVFAGWSGDCIVQPDNTCVVTMDKDYSVTATFNLAPRSLTVVKSGPGTGTVTDDLGSITCGATCNAAYLNGTTVTLTATPATGSTFAGWSNSTACTGLSRLCSIRMGADQTVTANFTVNTTTTVAISPTSAVSGQQVTFTATVAAASAGAGTPTGTVTFTVDSTPQGPFTLSPAGTATFSTSSLSVATHGVVASYTPAAGSGYVASASSTGIVSVFAAHTTTTLTQSPNPAPAGASLTITATVAPVAPGAGVPTGTVTFTTTVSKKTTTTTVALVNGVATLTVSKPASGQVYTVSYAGTVSYLSSSSSITLAVSKKK